MGWREVSQLSQSVQVIPLDPYLCNFAFFKPEDTNIRQFQFVTTWGKRSHWPGLCANILGPDGDEVTRPKDYVDFLHGIGDRGNVSFKKGTKFAEVGDDQAWRRRTVTNNICRDKGV